MQQYKWYKLRTHYYCFRREEPIKNVPVNLFYAHMLAAVEQSRSLFSCGQADNVRRSFQQFLSELMWYQEGQPSYRVWPELMPSLLNVELSKIPAKFFQSPKKFKSLAVLLPTENSICFTVSGFKQYARAILLTRCVVLDKLVPGITVWMDFGESDNEIGFDLPVWSYQTLIHTDDTVQQQMDQLRDRISPTEFEGWQIPENFLCQVMQLAVGICLLDTCDERVLCQAEKRNYWDVGRGHYIKQQQDDVENSYPLRLTLVGETQRPVLKFNDSWLYKTLT